MYKLLRGFILCPPPRVMRSCRGWRLRVEKRAGRGREGASFNGDVKETAVYCVLFCLILRGGRGGGEGGGSNV